MKLEIEVPDDLIDHLITSGIGGRYTADWCDEFSPYTVNGKYKGGVVREMETRKRLKLNVRRAIQLAITSYPWVLDPERLDSVTGDLFIQLAAFGEVRYG